MRPALLLSLLFFAGCHAQAGPVFSYAIGQGARFGWEAGGGWGMARGNVGQTFGPHPIDTEAGTDTQSRFGFTSYAVHEPGILFGATLGLGLRDDFEPSFVGGAWAAAPPLRTFTGHDRCDGTTVRHDASLTAGFRYVGGAFELYLSPKYLMFACEDLP